MPRARGGLQPVACIPPLTLLKLNHTKSQSNDYVVGIVEGSSAYNSKYACVALFSPPSTHFDCNSVSGRSYRWP